MDSNFIIYSYMKTSQVSVSSVSLLRSIESLQFWLFHSHNLNCFSQLLQRLDVALLISTQKQVRSSEGLTRSIHFTRMSFIRRDVYGYHYHQIVVGIHSGKQQQQQRRRRQRQNKQFTCFNGKTKTTNTLHTSTHVGRQNIAYKAQYSYFG